MNFVRRRGFLLAATILAFQASSAHAQHASDNPITAAEDAYGLTLGLESVGIYNPGLVRGFSPQAAGNIRIDGLYFDQQGGLSNRVIDGSTIRVGVTEIGYAFPAPTGIADYTLRDPGDGTPTATVIASIGPYEARGISIDGSIPLIGKELLLPIGVSTQLSTQEPFGAYSGYTSKVTSIGATPQWTPDSRITVRGLFDWQQSRDATTFPFFFTGGDYLPPQIPRRYYGQDWAKGRSATMNLGALATAQLAQEWTLRAGVFRSVADAPVSFADLYTDIQPSGDSDHLVIGYPHQNTTSTSGEMRLTGRYMTGDWRHEFIFMARGRDTAARYGGEDVVDVGAAIIGEAVQVPEPDFIYTSRALDRAKLWSVGAAYHLDWRKVAELELGIQKESYRETVASPGTPNSEVSAQPFRGYANTAIALTPKLTAYAGYTQGLEGSGVAPNSAANSGAVLPASLTWQADSGLRYVVTDNLKIIAGVFELQKPYFNLDTSNIDRELGVQRARGLELSVAGEVLPHLDINVGILDGRVGITGPDLAAEGVGSVAVGQPRITYVADANYTLPWWPAASLDASATHFGTTPESVDNAVYTPAVTIVNLGGRYKFSAWGADSSLRVEVQNVLNSNWWTNVYTPGFFPWPGGRTIFAYVTTDIR